MTRLYARHAVDLDVLDVPKMLPKEEGLTRTQITVLEAINVLSFGVEGVFVDERAIQVLAYRAWGARVMAGKQLWVMNAMGLLESSLPETRGKVGHWLWRTTHEGRLEHFSQRVGVFQ